MKTFPGILGEVWKIFHDTRKYFEYNWKNKLPGAPVHPPPPEMELGVQRLMCLKYFNVPKWESRFTSQLNVAKNMHYKKKCFK